MAPERSGQQGLSPKNNKKEFVGPPKHSSILEDFLEIKIKEELDKNNISSGSGESEDIFTSEVEVKSENTKKEEDEDLTSLTWLQNNNLLKSKPLTEPAKKQEESPTSDLTEETNSDSSVSHTSTDRQSPFLVVNQKHLSPSVAIMEEPATQQQQQQQQKSKHYSSSSSKDKHIHHSIPYDPQLHVSSKPPYSFSCLIFMAIEDSHARALPVKEIYSWITDHFPYFIQAPTGWKNSVRHNLSLNKCFRKVDKAPNLGKGSLWIVDPQYRPNLLNALSKAPYHPCASLDRQAKPPILPPTTLTPQQQEFIAMRTTQSRLPNPELFPYLSKRLAASEADRINEAHESDDDSLDDVDAATAMLELKHGQNSANGVSTREYVQQSYRKKKRVGDFVPLISTSPSEDHTYSVERTSYNYKKRQPVSPDEAYGGGSDSNDDSFIPDDDDDEEDEEDESWSSDGAEQRNVASALLHLAGGSRKRSVEPEQKAVSPKRVHKPKRPHLPNILQRNKKTSVYKSSRQVDDVSNNNNSNKYSNRPKSDHAR